MPTQVTVEFGVAVPVIELVKVGLAPVLIEPICDETSVVNHIFPSAPAAIPEGTDPARGTVNERMSPFILMRLTLFVVRSVNHIAPSGPDAIRSGTEHAVRAVSSVTTPVGVMRPMLYDRLPLAQPA